MMNASEMGKKGGAARARKLSAARRSDIASLGGRAAKRLRDAKKKQVKLKVEGSKNGK